MSARQLASPFPTARPAKLPGTLSYVRSTPLNPPTRSSAACEVGAQVRALRLAAGVSGGKVAAASGISPSMLSRIERGLVSPSVETLYRIARGLDVPISRFFGDQPGRTDFSHVPAGRGVQVDRVGAVANYRYELIGHILSGNLFVEPYLVTLLPGAEPYITFQHPGLKFLYLLSGKVSYRYGAKVVQLKVGDSLLFDATALHGIESAGSEPVSYLSVVFTLRG
ncbi:helix-turn-helix transcriptional regulator [Variovorax paradoxus]|nr:helix-turn-helix transcriptional regulator [Variovorax paradoxus]